MEWTRWAMFCRNALMPTAPPLDIVLRECRLRPQQLKNPIPVNYITSKIVKEQ